ncbi:MAG TPA: acetyl-CoA carboxylase biotin carboxyl carrier protein [Geminicoccaceae bacterium]|nr:acetyl-CoA carboxylase biotin carboxyl carrier protein [Geminicoccaceae bacterium]
MAKLNVDTSLIETLAELLQRTGLTEIEISEGDARIRVAREQHVLQAPQASRPAAAPAATAAPDTAAREAVESHPGAVRAPMVGTVYLTPEPGAAPFVSLGDELREGQTLLIIEAMKVMNPIRAPRSGRLVQLLVNSGDPVEYGELLMIIE